MKRMFTVIALLALCSSSSLAITPVNLGTASGFAVLAGSTVTNTGVTLINGDLGLSPGTSVTGFPPGIVNGTQHVADGVALQAKNDLVTAYNDAAGRTPVTTVGTELGGTTRAPGVYNSASGTFGITGTLTLDAQGNPNGVFIFQMASTLITASSSQVHLIRGAQACNVFWQVGSSATLGTYSAFSGNILALASITVTTGVSVNGRVLARNAAVTLDTDNITVAVNANGGGQNLDNVSVTPSFNAAEVTEYALHQNYPNPFNPTTSIVFDVVESGMFSLKVYNLMGQEVATLVNGMRDVGRYSAAFDGSGLSSGVYLYKLEGNGLTAEKKMLLLK